MFFTDISNQDIGSVTHTDLGVRPESLNNKELNEILRPNSMAWHLSLEKEDSKKRG